jgi:serine phosphatase RsbU (regulator of sigma subunit)
VIKIDDQRAALLLIDAGGQGIAGLVQASVIRGGVAAALQPAAEVIDLAAIVSALSRLLSRQKVRQLTPATFVLLDLAAAQVTYLNAGGMPPLLLTGRGRLVTLDQPALLLGVDPDYYYEATTVDVPPQFRLVCYTDGLVDAVNAAGEGFGEQRLHDLLLEREVFGAPAEMIGRIGDALEAHTAGHVLLDDALVCVFSKE